MRCRGVLDVLAKHHHVTVVLASSDPSEIQRFRTAAPVNIETYVALAEAPSTVSRLCSATIERYRSISIFMQSCHGCCRNSFAQIARQTSPDLIWFFRFETIWRVAWDKSAIPVVGDMDDFESKACERSLASSRSGWRRILARLDYPRFQRAERHVAKQCDVVLLANPQDAHVAESSLAARVAILQNGFDYSVKPDFDIDRRKRVVFIGALRYAPNAKGVAWFLEKVWPLVHISIPEAIFEIGGMPTEEAETWAKAPCVRVCGYLANTRAFLKDASVAIAPILSGGGTRIKILEAWAAGVPVVSTSIGCEGLTANDGESLFVADSPELFAQRCITLLLHPETGMSLARQGYEYGKRTFDWSILSETAEEVIQLATTGRRG